MQYYYIVVVLASILAGAGFATNSASAIMGGMLVSPFATPLIEGSSWHDLFKTWGVSVAICLFVGYLCGKTLLHASSPDTDEMISRTNWKENIPASIVIPATCGAILAIALKQKDIVIAVGVGLAVAVLPPLVETGMHISREAPDKAKSTFQLALANLFILSLTYIVTQRLI